MLHAVSKYKHVISKMLVVLVIIEIIFTEAQFKFFRSKFIFSSLSILILMFFIMFLNRAYVYNFWIDSCEVNRIGARIMHSLPL